MLLNKGVSIKSIKMPAAATAHEEQKKN